MNWIDHLLEQATPHSNGDFCSHLYSTGKILEKWGAGDDLVTAGRYHAIYSTASFDFTLINLQQRDQVAMTIGTQPEKLIYAYCYINYNWFWEHFNKIKISFDKIDESTKTFILPLTREMGYIVLSSNDILSIGAIILANHVEQAPRMPLFYQDDKLITQMFNIVKKILPQLPAIENLKNFDECKLQNAIVNLRSLLKWHEYPLKDEILGTYRNSAHDKFEKLLIKIDSVPLFSHPFYYIFSLLKNETQINCSLSPKVANLTLFKNSNLNEEGIANLYRWLTLQATVEGVLEFDRVGHGLTINDDYLIQDNKHIIFPSPRLTDSIIADFESYYDILWSDETFGEITPVIPSERFKVISSLRKAFAIINDLEPFVLDIIRSSVNVISIRTDKSMSLSSSSWPKYPGLIGMLNVQSEHTSIERIISAIVHESIHNFLYKIEINYPFSVDADRLFNISVQSLWTGRNISLESYIHACCVWFGLSNFWKKSIKKDLITENVLQEYKKAIVGFQTSNYLHTLERIKPYIRKDVFILLESFYEDVQIMTQSQ